MERAKRSPNELRIESLRNQIQILEKVVLQGDERSSETMEKDPDVESAGDQLVKLRKELRALTSKSKLKNRGNF